MKVFVDSGAWVALEVKSDVSHAEARYRLERLRKKRALFYTNTYVLSETCTRLIYDHGLSVADEFHKSILKGARESLAILEMGESERENAWKVLRKYPDHALSFTDATVVVNFEDFNLDEIFTFDRHFRDVNLPTNLK